MGGSEYRMRGRVFLTKLGTGSRECAKGFGLSQEADCIQFLLGFCYSPLLIREQAEACVPII